MKTNYLILFLFASLMTACEESTDTASRPDSLAVINSANYPLHQPVLLRDNLPNERGNNRLDSLKWQALNMQGLSPFTSNSGFFLLGKIMETPGDFTSILLYEENPGFNRAWIANYGPKGKLLDYRLVFYQNTDGKMSQSGYLQDNVLEIKKATTNTINYQLLPSGQFVALQ